MIMYISKDGCWTNQRTWQQERKAAAHKRVIALVSAPRAKRAPVRNAVLAMKVKL